MKKRLLIPILLTTTSLPLVSITGCGDGEDKILATSSWSLEDGEPVWTHEQPTEKCETVDEVNDAYYNSITPQILADDILYPQSILVWGYKEIYISSNISIKINNIDKQEKRLSYICEHTADVIPPSNNKEVTHWYTKIVCKNAPFSLYSDNYSDSTIIWKLHLTGTKYEVTFPEEYWDDQKWSISVIQTLNGEEQFNQILNYKIKDDIEQYEKAIEFAIINTQYKSKYFEHVELS